jgi:FkbM family methyltransferase
MRVAEIRRHSFITDWLSNRSVVLDLGMHRGEFGRAVNEAFACQVIGVEPVPDLHAMAARAPGITAEQRAVNSDGRPVELHLNRGSAACATIHPRLAQPGVVTLTVKGTTIGELLARHRVDRADLVKLDVEGAELEILEALDPGTLARIDQLTVEFHDFIDLEQSGAVQAVTERLRNAGFQCLRFSLDNSDVLFVNRRMPLSRPQRLWISARYKYPRGISRRVRRWLGRSE